MKNDKEYIRNLYKNLEPSRDKWHKEIEEGRKFIDDWFEKNKKEYLKKLKERR